MQHAAAWRGRSSRLAVTGTVAAPPSAGTHPASISGESAELEEEDQMRIGHFAGSLGRGLVAGLIGTGVMTIAQVLEMKMKNRGPSSAPAKAMEKVLEIEARGEDAEQRLSQLTHFAYGTSWGVARGLMGGLGMRAVPATSVHLLLVWGAALAMLPTLGLAPPVTKWSKAEVIEDLGLHAVYALATGAAFEWLEKRS
jgi:hypothetical protein